MRNQFSSYFRMSDPFWEEMGQLLNDEIQLHALTESLRSQFNVPSLQQVENAMSTIADVASHMHRIALELDKMLISAVMEQAQEQAKIEDDGGKS